MTGFIDRFRRRLELVTLVGLTLWTCIRYSGSGAFGLPFVVAWAMVVVAFLIGREGGPNRWAVTHWGTVRIVALGLVVGFVASLVAVVGFGVPRGMAARFAVVVAIATWVGMACAPRRRQGSTLVALMAAEAIATWPLLDSYLAVRLPGLYDFHVYIGAGQRLLAGGEPYLTQPLTHLPPSAFQDAFPYPPVLLPLFAAASWLPLHVADAAWVLLLVVISAIALRLFGLRWGWVALLLAFPPLVKGIDSGNIAYLGFPLYALGPYVGAALVLPILLKVQFAVPVLWLVRERRWRALAAAVGIVAVLVLATLPLVGVDRWSGWMAFLGYRATSQVNLPILYGLSLARYLPVAAFLAVSVVAVLLPLRLRGWRALAGLGLATIVVSPTLWPHGFLLALPAVLALDPLLLWPVLAIGVGGSGLWVLMVLGAVALVTTSGGNVLPGEPMHPFGGTGGPWPPRADPPQARAASAG